MIGYLILTTGIALVVLSPLIRVLEQITEGIYYMADLEAQAIADLNAGVDAVIAVLKSLAAAASTAVPSVDHSADIEAAVKKLSDAVVAVSAPAAAAPAATPAAPAA